MTNTNDERRVVELHNLASHAHLAAASAHDKGDHLTAHEQSRLAHEHSTAAHELSQKTSLLHGKAARIAAEQAKT
jgi:hypothetical protein